MTREPKVAIVTGASQGIGAGLASAFRLAGYAVVATALTMEPSQEAGFVTVSGDITDSSTADTVVSSALAEFGRIDTLVNNAGVFIGKPFADYTFEDYATMVAVNLTGFFHITQRAISQMASQKTGHVVNVSTSLVEHARTSSPAALAALTKGGLNAVTRVLAIEYAMHNVRVNTVELGVIETPLHPARGVCRARRDPPTPTPGEDHGRRSRRHVPRTCRVRYGRDAPYRRRSGRRRLAHGLPDRARTAHRGADHWRASAPGTTPAG